MLTHLRGCEIWNHPHILLFPLDCTSQVSSLFTQSSFFCFLQQSMKRRWGYLETFLLPFRMLRCALLHSMSSLNKLESFDLLLLPFKGDKKEERAKEQHLSVIKFPLNFYVFPFIHRVVVYLMCWKSTAGSAVWSDVGVGCTNYVTSETFKSPFLARRERI